MPNMIKIDAEGAEFRILKGMWKTIEKYHPAIICEVHPLHLKGQGIELKTLFEFLQKRDYRLFLISKDGLLESRIEELCELCGKRIINKQEYGAKINPIILAKGR